MNTQSKYPVAMFELIPAAGQNGSGFVREDTVNSKNPITIIHPKNRVIQNESIVRQKSGDVYINVPTRYVYNQPIILVKDQEAANIKPNFRTDKILFVNGLLTVPKDGAFVGLYEFMTKHAQNLSNPDRVTTLKPLFVEIKPSEDAHEENFTDFLITEAVSYLKQFVTEDKGKYSYNDARIDAICPLFNVYAESSEQKISALIAVAKKTPKIFLETVKKNEQTAEIEIQHGVKLNVLSFEGNTAFGMYSGQPEKIKSFVGNVKDKEKALANYFMSDEGKEAYGIFKAELTEARNKIIDQQ